MTRFFFTFITFSCFLTACTAHKKVLNSTINSSTSYNYKEYHIDSTTGRDTSIVNFLSTYSAGMSKTMNAVIGETAVTLEKKAPESTLGNFMADAMYEMATRYYGTKVDAAFVNYGGIRLNNIAAGKITRGKIFELMPFDNLIILQKIKGDILQQFLDLTASLGGWPAAGIQMQIKDKKAVNVIINGKPLDVNATYTIANSDYVANGGDNAAMLRGISQINKGYIFREALIEYITNLTQKGQKVSASLQNRVVNAE